MMHCCDRGCRHHVTPTRFWSYLVSVVQSVFLCTLLLHLPLLGITPGPQNWECLLSGISDLFRGPQLRAARSRVTINLFFSCPHRFLNQQSVKTLTHSLAKTIFYNPVLQRVEADDHQSAARLQQLRGRTQQRPQIVQFTVYEDSESLKGSCRRMNSPFCIHWPGRGCYDLRKLCGRSYRPRPDNGSGDSPRPPFLTEFVNHISKLALTHAIYHLFGGKLGLWVHPHVERSFRLKTESTRGV